MKKLQLRALEIGAAEVLSRAQLKKVAGGSGSGPSCWDSGPTQWCMPSHYGCCDSPLADCTWGQNGWYCF